jgi:hypothetical protein
MWVILIGDGSEPLVGGIGTGFLTYNADTLIDQGSQFSMSAMAWLQQPTREPGNVGVAQAFHPIYRATKYSPR